MAALCSVIIATTMAAMLSDAAIASMFTVGAPNGSWDITTDLQTWPSNLNFTVGDSLIFRYASNHDVVEVVKAEYDACTVTKPIQSFTGGNTLVFLPVAGKKYFICSLSGHCAAGMKLEVDIASEPGTSPPRSPLSLPAPYAMMPEGGAPSPSETPMASPPTMMTPTPLASAAPASDLATAPPPPKSSGAHGCCSTYARSAVGLMAGVLLVLVL